MTTAAFKAKLKVALFK